MDCILYSHRVQTGRHCFRIAFFYRHCVPLGSKGKNKNKKQYLTAKTAKHAKKEYNNSLSCFSRMFSVFFRSLFSISSLFLKIIQTFRKPGATNRNTNKGAINRAPTRFLFVICLFCAHSHFSFFLFFRFFRAFRVFRGY